MSSKCSLRAFLALTCLSAMVFGLALSLQSKIYAEENLISTNDEETVTAEEEVAKKLLPTSFWYKFIEAKEAIQLFFTFNDSSKASLLEDFCMERVDEISYADSVEDYDAIKQILVRYEDQKKTAVKYAKAADDDEVMDKIAENTLEQEQVMTQIQLRLENKGELQQNMVQVQTEVSRQVRNVVKTVQGTEAANEFTEKVRYVWIDPNADEYGNLPPLPDDMEKWEYAPGTEGRNDNGAVIKYIEVKEGSSGDGGEKNVVIEEQTD